MNQAVTPFFHIFYLVLPYIAGLIFIVGLGIFLGYLIRLWSIDSLKGKYDFISLYETRIIWNSSILLLISLVLYPKNLISSNIYLHQLYDFIIELILAVILGIIIRYSLKYYYPTFLNRRLKRLRYKTRISPKTGKPMKLLTEEEEDVYLDEGMQAEEDVFSVEYDVWIDEESGYTQIEKYSGKLTARKCPRCGYQTLKVEKEELIIAPTPYSSGELMKRYKCTYCGHKEKEIFTVAKLKEER